MERNQPNADDSEEQSETEPFADAPLDPEAILGTRTFESVLFSEEHAERTVPVDARTGERTRQIEDSVERAEAFVADDPRRVAVPQRTEAMVETQSAPYVSTIFYDSKVVRGKITDKGEYGRPTFANNGHDLEWTYRAATQSDQYDVELVEADYETGDVTITVEEVA
ncbi:MULTISPECIES: hypothetical protein [Halococcus]|uniref:DUF8025 domain-containing protein n=1 Tax=Halococcus saccharolyticus DSM 5350 TaxID=1227455 RepID=M0MGP1_9EURY|nr:MULTISPECIES: hypothetical protein [Halococcus]EMA43575.1 hypothetical protein C449_13487 [Halococcus saccharolyticus DSM 5350]